MDVDETRGQDVMARLKAKDFGIDMKFDNYR